MQRGLLTKALIMLLVGCAVDNPSNQVSIPQSAREEKTVMHRLSVASDIFDFARPKPTLTQDMPFLPFLCSAPCRIDGTLELQNLPADRKSALVPGFSLGFFLVFKLDAQGVFQESQRVALDVGSTCLPNYAGAPDCMHSHSPIRALQLTPGYYQFVWRPTQALADLLRDDNPAFAPFGEIKANAWASFDLLSTGEMAARYSREYFRVPGIRSQIVHEVIDPALWASHTQGPAEPLHSLAFTETKPSFTPSLLADLHFLSPLATVNCTQGPCLPIQLNLEFEIVFPDGQVQDSQPALGNFVVRNSFHAVWTKELDENHFGCKEISDTHDEGLATRRKVISCQGLDPFGSNENLWTGISHFEYQLPTGTRFGFGGLSSAESIIVTFNAEFVSLHDINRL